jgi:hypothetical protein
VFVKVGRKIDYNLLRGRLPQYAKDDIRRTKHTYILVPLKKSENVNSKRAAVLKQLNDVVKNKYNSGQCKAKRDPNKPEKRQNFIKKTCPNTITKKGKSPQKEAIPTSDYFICPVDVSDLKLGIRLVEFNLQNPSVECRASERGLFHAGMGILKKVNDKPLNTEILRKETDWFLINHLDGSQLHNDTPCSNK